MKKDIRKKLYDLIVFNLENGFHFENDIDYRFFIENIAKKGIPIFGYKYQYFQDDYKTSLKITYQYFNNDNEPWLNCMNLFSTNIDFKIPKFEIGE